MKFVQRAKRRRAGIYLVRTRKHFGRGRENGYVGRSNYTDLRRGCHLGVCCHANHYRKDWSDLDPHWHVLKLPWWTSWKWSQSAIEALAIWTLMPRYNVLLNKKNPRYTPPSVARLQRAARDANRWNHRVAVKASRAGALAWQLSGALLIVLGGVMTILKGIG